MSFNKRISKFLAELMVTSLAASSIGYIQILACENHQDINENHQDINIKKSAADILDDILKPMTEKQKQDFINVLYSGLHSFISFPDEYSLEYSLPNSQKFLDTLEYDVVCASKIEPLTQRLRYRLNPTEYNAIKASIQQYCNKIYDLHQWSYHRMQDVADSFFPIQQKNIEYFGDLSNWFRFPAPLTDNYTVNETHINEDQMNEPCIICLHPLSDFNSNGIKTPCSHLFHEFCLQQWFEHKRECPICKKGLDVGTTLLRLTK